MRRLPAAIAAILLALFVLPAFVAADDKDKKDPAPDAKKDDTTNTEKTMKAGEAVGKLVEVNETAKSIKLEITIEYSKPNAGEINALAQAQINYANAVRNRDVNGALNAQRDMAYHAARTTSIEKKTQNVDITSTDDVKVRKNDPPTQFDDKGNIKKLTEKELKELKGDSKLPGYPAEFSDLHTGDYVKVTLVKKKGTHPEGPKPKDADPDPLGDNLPQASLILIYSPPPAGK
jgi:hypothetical protein